MISFLVTEEQFKKLKSNFLLGEEFKLAESNWENFSENEKKSIVEFLQTNYPNKKNLNEAEWYNTLGDIVGIFDPSGVVDLVNGISYIKQGDNLFGFLSIVSAVPYVGDAVAKPVMGALKVGAPSAKALEGVLKTAKAGDTLKASEDLAKLTNSNKLIDVFVSGFGKIANVARGFIEKLPRPFGGLKKTILQWFDLFEKGAKSGKALNLKGAGIAAKLGKDATQIQKLEDLIQLAKDTPGLFTGYRTSKGLLSWKTVFGGMPQLIGRNKSVRALARQTKWWGGFLDWLGLGNYVGPDEVLAQMGQEDLESKVSEYQKTPEAQKYFDESFQ
ncbi:hypothetical protein EBU94_07555, partial [bacterium]|nr:hypothetical protein [bacterium]